MPKIPEYQRQLKPASSGTRAFSVQGPSQGIEGFGSAAGASLNRGISNVQKARQGVIDYRLAIQEKEQAESNAKETAKFSSTMRRDWARRFREHQENPHDQVGEQILEEWDAYKNESLNNASNQDVRDAIEQQLNNFEISIEEKGYNLQQLTRAANYGAAFDEMYAEANDAIFDSKDLEELEAQEGLLKDFVDAGVESGRIRDKATADKLKAKADQLAYTWGLAAVGEQPELVKQAIDEGLLDKVSPEKKQSLLNKADQAIKSQQEIDKVALDQAFKSDLAQRLETGSGESWSYEAAVEAYGKTKADQQQRQLDRAADLFLVNSRMQGADGVTLLQEVENSKPKAEPGSDKYKEELDYHNAVRNLASQQQADKLADPYSYFTKDPAIAGLFNQLMEDPENLDLHQDIQNTILAKQKADKTIPVGSYSIMSKSEALSLIDTFSNAVAVGSTESDTSVRDTLNVFEQKFGGNVSYALNQLFNTTGGDKVASQINPLMWHLNNPSSFRMVLDAVRKDDNEVMKLFPTEDKADFLDSVALSAEMVNYRASVVSTDNSPLADKIVNGTSDTFRKFARDFVLNGGDVDQASELFFSYYTFGEANNATYARPRNYVGEDGKVHTLDEATIRNSDDWLETELRDLAFNKKNNLDPTTVIPSTKFLTEEQISDDLEDSILTNGFWSTSEDETGVYLFVKGAYPGTAVQVFDKENEPVFIPFTDTYKVRQKIGIFGQEIGAPTGETFTGRLARTLRDL